MLCFDGLTEYICVHSVVVALQIHDDDDDADDDDGDALCLACFREVLIRKLYNQHQVSKNIINKSY